jgi:alpha-amylase/alpha-mannosidase (GH57 family)
VTFNLVPSLLVQLEAFAENRARDRVLDVGLKPAADLAEVDAAFMLQNFFHAQRQRMIDVHPRYGELLAKRGGAAPTSAQAHAAARRFSVDDLRDLQVWQKLAWCDPFYLEHDPRLRRLVEKGSQFSEEDKAVLREVELEILNAVIPTYRDAAQRGQVELSTSPFYHPILPLLCDTDIYKRTHPESRMPRSRFMRPEDAAEQLGRAVINHVRLFGQAPQGLWPSEGSVSDAMVPIVAEHGFSWMATDELILARTLDITFGRDGAGHLEQPERLYRPYVVTAGGARVSCAFRDHGMSDLIGFVYQSWAPEAAAQDFASRLAEAGRRYSARTGGGEAMIPIILDGENAWEHFEGGGRPFLRALYRQLSEHPELRTVTMAEGCRSAQTEIPSIFPGSWIDANFYIWIGHADDHRAWGQLGDARQALESPGPVDPAALAAAHEEVLIAEGSDWFWWYGDDHSSDHDLEFDDLFRRHLRNVYRLLQKPVPDELFVSNISAGALPPVQSEPSGLLSPKIDGEETSYFEWLGAGSLEVREAAGAMHQIERRQSLLRLVLFGFDHEHLFVRMDGTRRLADLLADGYEFSLTFLRPDGVRFSVRHHLGRLTGALSFKRGGPGQWVVGGAGETSVSSGTVLEISIPLSELGVTSGELSFFVAVSDSSRAEVERHPAHRPIETLVPDAAFEARNWTA